MLTSIVQLDGPLNLADRGLLAAELVLPMLANTSVVLDCARVTRVTPSYANAFLMTLLETVPDAWDTQRLVLRDALPHVRAEFEKAVDRYRRGIRLSSQRPAVA